MTEGPPRRHAALRRAAEVIATIAYPAGVHAGITLGHLEAALGVLCATSVVLLVSSMLDGNGPGALLFALLLALGGAGLTVGRAEALFFPSLAMVLALLLLFARTLLPGREPLVTRIARTLGDEGADVARYTRAVTWAWVIFFALLTLELILLAKFAPLVVWSLFSNFINYLLAVALFVAEFFVRRRVLRHRRTARWREFRHADWKSLLGP